MYGPYRRAAQTGTFIVMFLIPVLNLYEIYTLTGTFYAINIGRLGIADPVVILQAIFAAGELSVPLASAALFPVALALAFGRVWCGWMCPYHLLADVASWTRGLFRAKIIGKTGAGSLPVTSSFTANAGRFGFLVLGTAFAGAIGIPVLNYVNAPGIVSTEAMIFVKERALSIEFVFLAVLVILELTLAPRFWCRLFCPTGALLSLFRMRVTLRVATTIPTPRSACCREKRCTEVCPMGLEAFREGSDLLCTNCGRCVDACASVQGPGRLRFTGFRT